MKKKLISIFSIFLMALLVQTLGIFTVSGDANNKFIQARNYVNTYITYYLANKDYTSWGLEDDPTNSSINIQNAWKELENNSTPEVVVAVVDTGIDHTHPYLKDNIYIPQGKVSDNNYGRDFSKKSKGENSSQTKPYDGHGHGTHVSGIIKSVYKDVKILTLKYYDAEASGQENLKGTISALEYAVEANVHIINYSGGGPEPSTEELKILKDAEKKGILVVAAAGNEHSNIDKGENSYYPASYGLKNIITVTAIDQSLSILPSSNWGAESVDLAAPGNKIRSGLPHDRTGQMTGTSQATAFVSGVAALLKSQYPDLTAVRIKEILMNSARKIPSLKGKCKSQGLLDAALAMKLAREFSKPAAPAKNSHSPASVTEIQK